MLSLEVTGLQHKVVLITGASGAIGQSLAAEFSCAGATVVICSRNEDKLRAWAEQLRRDDGQTLPLQAINVDGGR